MENTEKEKLFQLQQIIEDTQATLAQATQLLRDLGVRDLIRDGHNERARSVGQLAVEDDSKIIEGVFDGQHMIGPDGKQYAVPANYASKSKLVEGDILKLTITSDGSFLYKQIGPVERKRLLGVLVKDEEKNDFRVLAEGRSYRVLLASVTYYKGEAGDEAVILVPKDIDSKWAAVENVVKNFSAKMEEEKKKVLPKEKKKSKTNLLESGADMELTDHPTKTEEDDDFTEIKPHKGEEDLEDFEL